MAADIHQLDGVTVIERSWPFTQSDTASDGRITREQIESRSVYRMGEVLEAVPGMMVTQHSGEGKATQYYLRGFNLDHGTDFAISVDDMPVNMRSHAHGQGYLDLNFIMPELIRDIHYRKGTYAADDGDFATAGSARISYVDRLDKDMGEIGAGSFGYGRGMAAMSRPTGTGHITIAAEAMHLNGPWDNADGFRKGNAMLRYSNGTSENGWSATLMAYGGKWNATDQVPRRAFASGRLSRWGTIDPSDGGWSHRISLSGRYIDTSAESRVVASFYVIGSGLDLYNNFTYFLTDQTNGDQFHQREKRIVSGGRASYTGFGAFMGRDAEASFGTELRNDEVNLGLFRSRSRDNLRMVRGDDLTERSGAIFTEGRVQWLPKMRTVMGLRGDLFAGEVRSNAAANSGNVVDAKLSPKGSVTFGPWLATELYASAGLGYHSNDLRAATTTLSPNDGSRLTPFPLLVRAAGEEIGLRTTPLPRLTTSLAVFQLDLRSEQVYAGDTGDTRPSGSSRRRGIELANAYTVLPGLHLDTDIGFTRSSYDRPVSDGITSGTHIAGSPALVAGVGMSLRDFGRWSGGLQYRMFGERPLTNANSVQSSMTQIVNARIGYRLDDALSLRLDIDNLLNAHAQQIAYFYGSRLPGEPAGGVNDVHYHPAEPLGVRLSLVGRW